LESSEGIVRLLLNTEKTYSFGIFLTLVMHAWSKGTQLKHCVHCIGNGPGL